MAWTRVGGYRFPYPPHNPVPPSRRTPRVPRPSSIPPPPPGPISEEIKISDTQEIIPDELVSMDSLPAEVEKPQRQTGPDAKPPARTMLGAPALRGFGQGNGDKSGGSAGSK